MNYISKKQDGRKRKEDTPDIRIFTRMLLENGCSLIYNNIDIGMCTRIKCTSENYFVKEKTFHDLLC